MGFKRTNNIKIEDAKIIFRNFSGEETKYNRKGDRNFCVILPDEEIRDENGEVISLLHERLAEDGWNIRILKPRDEEDEPKYYIPVSVSFEYLPPNVVLVTKNKRNQLTEETINVLDFSDIRNVDLTIRPYNWEVNNKTGIKGYLKTMYVTIEEDEFAEKYAMEEAPEEDPE